MTFDEWNAEPYARTFEDAWKAGAASRDAEVAELRKQLEEMTGRNLVNRIAVRLQKEKVAELVALLNCVQDNLNKGMSRSIQKLQAGIIKQEITK